MQTSPPFLAFAASDRPLTVHHAGDRLRVAGAGEALLHAVVAPGRPPRLAAVEIAAAPEAALAAVAAALEALTASETVERVVLEGDAIASLAPALHAAGLALPDAAGGLTAHAAMAWQRPEPWLGRREAPFPALAALSGGRRHPVRAPKPAGVVYTRWIPWLAAPLSFRVAHPEADLDRLHAWMNDPRVAAVWDEAGDAQKHRRYLETLTADPHVLPLVGSIGGEPFGWFEVYWAKENRIAPFCEAGDHDRGWHVLIGEERFRGRAHVSAWLPSLMHAIFLDDPRTVRIVGEPRADHARQLRNLERSGFARIATFDFPHKRAALVSLGRERFFGDRLWVPGAATEAVS
ncbi:hypothetical protein OPKNFCMD_4253 [Methylobacterium crusticola]|uniref:Acyltransferase MbtK/IucB-like conserved domain-containing protein n=1 Tax=Methylobacterium crusticola TaxID=1697972 RepID=A0ABQ4R1S5_9HYPH|nr:GNAT family N-acetyltransferase [Methylobacterium crusticola]GJD51498.1 hypothetical protein OPKNFCMD_4253 [Methylobacterium crusticola]